MNNARRDEEWLRANRPTRSTTHCEVRNPAHYTEGREYEPIDVIEDWQLPFHLGNALKYIARAGRKDPSKTRQDISKAIWYLERFSDQFVEDEHAAKDADELIAGKFNDLVAEFAADEQNEREFEALGEIPSSILFGSDNDAIPYDYSAEIHAAEKEFYSTQAAQPVNVGIPGASYDDIVQFTLDQDKYETDPYDKLPSDVEPFYGAFDR